MARNNLVVYLLRRDLRTEDNPVLQAINKAADAGEITHVLPVYVFAAQQIEVSGLIKDGSKSPYPEARSPTGNYWRCGPWRAKFIAESVWDLKDSLKSIGSDLEIRAGMVPEIVKSLIEGFGKEGDMKVGQVWMTSEEGVEEKREEREVDSICQANDINFRLFKDEKYFIDDRDVPFKKRSDLPDVFTSYRKMVEPLRKAPRSVIPKPKSLPPLPDNIPKQHAPFTIPSSLDELKDDLMKPVDLSTLLPNPPKKPNDTSSAHPFIGGSSTGLERINHLMSTGSMTGYKSSRNGLLGTDFSTKLSAWLALGCITARQVHESLLQFEDGKLTTPVAKTSNVKSWADVRGYGKGENDGTKAVRFELLWRDYMRLCTRKFGPQLFRISGFCEDTNTKWRYKDDNSETQEILTRFLEGTTGMGLIDASQRELFLTGYTSNRARQNVASFLAKHLNMDWRLGAEWYESMLIDYDVSSNWGNWQYVAGVGNDPRGEARVFNPVKQAFDYDAKGEYVLSWVSELKDASKKGRGLEVKEIFQAWEIPREKKEELGLADIKWVNQPLKQIQFTAGRGGGGGRGGRGGGRGGRGGRGGGGRSRNPNFPAGGGGPPAGNEGGQGGGYANARYGSGGGGGHDGQGYGGGRGNGRGGS